MKIVANMRIEISSPRKFKSSKAAQSKSSKQSTVFTNKPLRVYWSSSISVDNKQCSLFDGEGPVIQKVE